MNPVDIRHFLEQDGWKIMEIKSEYWVFVHPLKPGKIAIPNNKDELPPATLDTVLKKAGLKK